MRSVELLVQIEVSSASIALYTAAVTVPPFFMLGNNPITDSLSLPLFLMRSKRYKYATRYQEVYLIQIKKMTRIELQEESALSLCRILRWYGVQNRSIFNGKFQ